jgi:hypothetical protein
MSSFIAHSYDIWDRALDSLARESRHIRRHRLGAWRPGRCDPRPPPRVLPSFRLLGRIGRVLVGATFYPRHGPGPPADVATIPCPFCDTPIQIWSADDPLRAAAQDEQAEPVPAPMPDWLFGHIDT